MVSLKTTERKASLFLQVVRLGFRKSVLQLVVWGFFKIKNMKRPVEYLTDLTEKNGMHLPSPVLDEIIKQMVWFARDYAKNIGEADVDSDFEELEKEFYGHELLPSENKINDTKS